MATCDICGLQTGFFDARSLENDSKRITISICGECFSEMESIKKGDAQAYIQIHNKLDSYNPKEWVFSFVDEWENHSPEIIKLKSQQYEEIVREQEYHEEYLKKRAEALPNILVSSGFSFEGYRIVKYSGYISGDDVVQLPREIKFFAGTSDSTTVGEELTNALVKIRRQALKELKEAAYDLGCNAIIGVDFDYITLEPETSNISGHTVYLPFVLSLCPPSQVSSSPI